MVYEITIATAQRRRLLAPSPEFNDVVAGAFARAQELFPAADLSVAVGLSTHLTYHVWSDEHPEQIPRFCGFVHQRISDELRRLRGWRGVAWERRMQPIAINPNDEKAMAARLRYVIAQGAKDGLVWSPLDWPGFTTVKATARSVECQGYWFERDAERRALNRGIDKGPYGFATRRSVRISKAPCWAHLSDDEYQQKFLELVHDVEREARETREHVLGKKELMNLDPFSTPEQDLERSPAPLVHASSQEGRAAFSAQYVAWVAAYRDAAAIERHGGHPEYPFYSFPPRRPMVLPPPDR